VFNPQQLLGQFKKMQEEMQQKMETLRVEGSAGGGMVTVQASGTKHILKVSIEPQVIRDDDIEMLQDLIQAATNDALRKVDEALKQQLGGMAGALGAGLPGGLKIPGLFE
jgi:DNA-binding YbaB/EbfC family protein